MFIRVYPPFEGFVAERFLLLAKQLEDWQLNRDINELETIWINEQEWMKSQPQFASNKLKYDAAGRILIDLARLRWTIKQENARIELNSPQFYPANKVTAEQISEYKTTVRAELDPICAEQFRLPSVKKFIERMENPPKTCKRESVFKLIADGDEIYSRIEPAISCEGNKRDELLSEAIKPYLQLVPGESEKQILDEFTKIPLGEIWRYFRYTWSIPQLSIPGRTMLYLIRDGGHPYHAIMGIAALNNTAMMLKPRDTFIGWNRDAFYYQVGRALKGDRSEVILKELLQRLEKNIEFGLNMVDPSGLVSPDEIENPTQDAIKNLRMKGEEFSKLREKALKNIYADADQPEILQDLEFVDETSIQISQEVLDIDKTQSKKEMKEVVKVLVLKKRAFELSHLLLARCLINKYRDQFLNPKTTKEAIKSDEFSTAVNYALQANKSAHVGSNMLEITTCGAISPYNLILGGKLTALLMLSPKINYDYMQRYGKQPSIISSQLKNSPVYRDNRLVYLGTTSLYALGSSQYERIKLPKGIISPEQPEIKYNSVGYSSGFGTVQFMPDTVRATEAVLEEKLGFQNVNHVFGEGPSPKLRKIRAGLEELGFDASVLLKHNQPRKIYGMSLCENALAFLCGEQVAIPEYIENPEKYLDATERIADFWRKRWLSKRIDHYQTIENLKTTGSWKLSEKIPQFEECKPNEVVKEMPTDPLPVSIEKHNVNFWKGFALAGPQVCSDELNSTEIDRLHITRPIEKFILEKVNDGFSIVLTGNAGDGKTHILRRLEPELKKLNAVIQYDATAAMTKGKIKPVIAQWKKAQKDGRPYCLAANEFPLYILRRDEKENFPLLKEVDRQCRQRLVYDEKKQDDEEVSEKVIVIDLSLRNPLSPEFAKEMLNKILSDEEIKEFAQSGKDPIFSKNFKCLEDKTVQKRLLLLFDRLAIRGYRTSVREIWILISRLLFGNSTEKNLNELSPHKWYSERLFEMDNRFEISNYLREYCDPVQFSHPRWDIYLEQPGKTKNSDWIVEKQEPVWSTKKDDVVDRFQALKRKFYFEHVKGPEVFALEDEASKMFESFINSPVSDITLKKQVIGAINRCYCPIKFSGWNDALYLWIGHRYHEKPTISFVANQSISHNEFQLLLPRLPNRVQNILEYRPDHFLLQYKGTGKKPISLRIDYLLYNTLEKIIRGMPRQLVPERDINRLDMFMERMQALDIPQNREFLTYNVYYGEFTKFHLSADWQKYNEVMMVDE
jgi:hypothetical protein